MYCVRTIVTNFMRKNAVTAQRKLNKPHSIPRIAIPYVIPRYNSDIADETDLIVQEICKGDEDLEKRLRILMLEVEVMRQDGRTAPDSLQMRHWKHLLELQTRNQRSKYLGYLFKNEKSRENDKAKKQARRLERETTTFEQTKEYEDDLLYGISNSSLFLRIYPTSMDNYYNYRAVQAAIDGQKIVIDCSYEKNMVPFELTNAAKQMTFVFGDNRVHKDPFDIHLCNVNKDGKFLRQLKSNIPTIEEPWFPMHIHSESYLDLFPQKDLVYLTPHCRDELTEFDPDAIYIIGCMVDKVTELLKEDAVTRGDKSMLGWFGHLERMDDKRLTNEIYKATVNNEPLSLAKAKKDRIKMAKLPLDRYLEWAPGSRKNLNINHMVPILLDLKLTNDWEFALQHIPRRKLMETKINAMQKIIKNKNLSRDLLKSFNNVPGFNKKYLNKNFRQRRSLYDDDD